MNEKNQKETKQKFKLLEADVFMFCRYLNYPGVGTPGNSW